MALSLEMTKLCVNCIVWLEKCGVLSLGAKETAPSDVSLLENVFKNGELLCKLLDFLNVDGLENEKISEKSPQIDENHQKFHEFLVRCKNTFNLNESDSIHVDECKILRNDSALYVITKKQNSNELIHKYIE